MHHMSTDSELDQMGAATEKTVIIRHWYDKFKYFFISAQSLEWLRY